MATKSKLDQFIIDVADADRQIAEERTQALKHIKELQGKAKAQESTLEAAQEVVDNIDAAWSNGDDSISTDEYREAQSEATKAQKVLNGLRKKVRLTKAPNVDTSAAELYAEALRHSFDGHVPVIVTCSKPGAIVPPIAAMPVAVVHQSEPVTINGRGSIDGTCKANIKARYYRLPIHRMVDGEAVDKYLAGGGDTFNSGWSNSVPNPSEETTNDALVFVDKISVNASHAELATPYIEELSPMASSSVAGVVLAHATMNVRPDDKLASLKPTGRVTVDTDDDGVRTITVDAVFGLGTRNRDIYTDNPTPVWATPRNTRLEYAASASVGEHVSGVGRVVACEYTGPVKGSVVVEDHLTGDPKPLPLYSYKVELVSSAVPPIGANVR